MTERDVDVDALHADVLIYRIPDYKLSSSRFSTLRGIVIPCLRELTRFLAVWSNMNPVCCNPVVRSLQGSEGVQLRRLTA
jgi:hypothetical protein